MSAADLVDAQFDGPGGHRGRESLAVVSGYHAGRDADAVGMEHRIAIVLFVARPRHFVGQLTVRVGDEDSLGASSNGIEDLSTKGAVASLNKNGGALEALWEWAASVRV